MSTSSRLPATRLALLSAGLLPVVLTIVAGTQTPSRPPGADYDGQAFRFERIQEGIYHAVGTGRLTVGCNGAVLVNATDVLLVDSHITPAAAWALQQELKAITPHPVRYVVNTHFHFDHAHGNQAFGPEVEIIGHAFTRRMLAAGVSIAGRSYELFVGGLPQRIAALEGQVEATADPVEKEKLAAQLAVQKTHLVATTGLRVVPPTLTVDESLTLHRGGREIRLLFLGRGHTGGDLVVHLPKERVVMTGDLLTAGPPYLGDGYFSDWVTTLDRLKRLDFDHVLPGHGDAFAGKAKIDHLQAYLRDFSSQVETLHRSGTSAEEAARRVDLRKHTVNYPSITQAGILPHGVFRAYELLEGKVQ